MKSATFALLLLLVAAAPALAQESPPVEPLNKYCPVMEGEKVNPDLYVDYEGKRVWFCCESCVEDFKNDPTAYLAKLPQFAVAADGDSEDAGEEEHESGEHPLGVLHPMMVHFPIALAMAAALAALLGLLIRTKFLKDACTYTIVLAALFSVPTYLLGEQAEEGLGRMSAARHEVVEEHAEWGEIAMYVLLAVALVQIVHRFLPDTRWLKWVAFFAVLAAAAAVGIAGWHGAEVAQGVGHMDPVLKLLGLKK